MNEGLSQEEAKTRLAKVGYNELASSKPKNIGRIAFEVMKEPMFILLISCGILYILLGDYREGIILSSSIFIIIFITFYQYQKTEKALSALKKLASPRALVLRDGQFIKVAGRELVPDDIIILNEGDRVPADGELIESTNLTIDESLLTGESIPAEKNKQTENKDNLIFSGTLVVQGSGKAKITATGENTQFGKIGKSLESIEQDETRLQKEMKVLIRNLFIFGGIISAGVVIAFYITRGNFIQSLLSGLASSMAILPEEFPVVLTVFMALGAWRLSKKNVLTRTPSAIETLGSATVLCSDKTGTITQNKMQVKALLVENMLIPENAFLENKTKIEAISKTAFLACQNNPIDPMEKAIADCYHLNFKDQVEEYTLIKEYPLQRELTAMTRVLEHHKNKIIAAKGAPETIFKLCKLSESEIKVLQNIIKENASKGYRILGVAQGVGNISTLPESQTEIKYLFVGLLILEDPIRAEVPTAIKECKEAGIRVIMITGDHPETARSIGNQIGMDSNAEIVTGAELEKMSDEELKIKIRNINIFARVIPEQKLRIVLALKANNEIVAMTGDGVNDAPALKAANIGIAMGNKGTDVAREASSLVLLDDNFTSIVSAIRNGRKVFDNLQKAMSYIIAVHIPIIGLALIPAFNSALPILLFPLHIVFMELIIDPICSIAFESEQEEKGIMQRPPRNPNEKFFGFKKIIGSSVQGLLLLIMVILVYYFSFKEGHSEGEARAITFSSLIIGNIFLILTNLSKTRSFVTVLLERNWAVIIILSIAFIMLWVILAIPMMQNLFSVEFPGYRHLVTSVLGAGGILVILELFKFFKLKS